MKLTAQEYKLLSYLMHHKGKVVSRTELIEHIYDQDFDRDSNTIEVFVTRIRKKLGADVITTIRGLGYSLEEPGQLNEQAAPADGGGRGSAAATPQGAAAAHRLADPAHDRRRGAVDRGAAADRRLRARPGAVALDRRQLRQPAGLRPQLDDRRRPRSGPTARCASTARPPTSASSSPIPDSISRSAAQAPTPSRRARCGTAGCASSTATPT